VSARIHVPAEPAERSRPGMSTDRITAAALQIVDTEGSQALTMRRLGQALGRKVMTLYRYVPSKDALLDGVVARVLTDLAINPAATDWRQELRDLATSFRGLAPAHPTRYPRWLPGTHQPSRATARTRRSSPRRASAGPGFRPVRQGKVDSVSLTCKLNM
jgi:AcrR family transcriptional regulator